MKLNREGVLYQKPYVESSPAYKSVPDGIQKSDKLPDWMKEYFRALSEANLGVHPSPFCHQVSALEASYDEQDLFVATGTGSGKTECFMWPLMAKLANEARNDPESWSMRGVRTSTHVDHSSVCIQEERHIPELNRNDMRIKPWQLLMLR